MGGGACISLTKNNLGYDFSFVLRMDLSWGDSESVVFDGWRICDVGAVVWVGGPGAKKGGWSGIVAYAWEGWHLLHVQFGSVWNPKAFNFMVVPQLA